MREARAQGNLILPKNVGYMDIMIYFGRIKKQLYIYSTIIPRARVGYEMIDN